MEQQRNEQMEEVALIQEEESLAMSAARKRPRQSQFIEAPIKALVNGAVMGGAAATTRGKEQSPETISTKQSLSNGITGLVNGVPGDESSGTYTGTSV